jgi:hypothetical protein
MFLGFEKSRVSGKMYAAILKNKDTGRELRVNFGSTDYENYHDLTGLNRYPHLIHDDLNRRRSYQKRHRHNVHKNCYNPAYFSYYYLW